MAKYKGMNMYAKGGVIGAKPKPKLMGQSVPGAMYQMDPKTGIQYEIEPTTFKRTGKELPPEGNPTDAKVSKPKAPKDTRWKPNATEVNKKGERVPTKATRKYRKKHDMEPMKFENGAVMGLLGKNGANALGTAAGLGSTAMSIASSFKKPQGQDSQQLLAKYGMRYSSKKKK